VYISTYYEIKKELRQEMMVDLVFVTRNRLQYTKLSLPRLLSDPTEEFSLTIWDNGSIDGTKEYLSSLQDTRIVQKVFSKKNIYLHGAANDVFSKSSADLVGIIPNDFLVTPGWTRPLANAHADVPQFGMIGCWHFFPEDFDYEQAKHKIQKFGQHRILRHPWTGGGAGLVKLKTVRECGPFESSGTTSYWMRMALKGYVNGFYFPLIYVEHMDDPRSEHSRIKYMSFDEAYKDCYGYQVGKIKDMEGYKQLHKEILENLLTGPYEPKYYCGWRAKFRRGLYITNKILKKGL
jgi:glycosyltransferase involved in cell wall biosynthesis